MQIQPYIKFTKKQQRNVNALTLNKENTLYNKIHLWYNRKYIPNNKVLLLQTYLKNKTVFCNTFKLSLYTFKWLSSVVTISCIFSNKWWLNLKLLTLADFFYFFKDLLDFNQFFSVFEKVGNFISLWMSFLF